MSERLFERRQNIVSAPCGLIPMVQYQVFGDERHA
jgi:hypothetical protein